MTKFLLIFNYYQIIIHNYKKFTFEVFPDASQGWKFILGIMAYPAPAVTA